LTCREADKLESGIRLAGALWWYWFTRSLTTEGRKWLEQLVEHREEVGPEFRVKLLNGAGAMAYSAGDYLRSSALHKEALELSKQIGDVWNASFSLGSLAIQYTFRGELERARAMAEESLTLAREIGDKWLIADELLVLGHVLTLQW